MDWHRGIVIGTSSTGFVLLGPILEGSIITDLSVLISVGATTFVVLSPVLASVGQPNAAAHAAGVPLFAEGAIGVNDRPGMLVTTQVSIPFELRMRMHRWIGVGPRYLIVAAQNFSGAQTLSVFASARAEDGPGSVVGVGGGGGSARRPSAGSGLAGLGEFRDG